MKCKAPDFWGKRGVTAYLLFPASLMYCAYMLVRELFYKPERFTVPIICVGNVTVGGAGKTPLALEIGKILLNDGKKIAFVSRGYGGSVESTVKVDIDSHTFNDVGDEPLLLARIADCWVSKNRSEGIKAAIENDAEVIILDDGLQDISIQKSLSLIVIDGGYGFGNRFVLPAGSLRNALEKSLAKADAYIIIGDDEHNAKKYLNNSLPLLKANFIPYNSDVDKSIKYTAFAGIGRPQKFFHTLRKAGVNIAEEIEYPDHHKYTKKDINNLLKRAEKSEAKLITTQKDAVKIPQDIRSKTTVFDVRLDFENKKALIKLLKKHTEK